MKSEPTTPSREIPIVVIIDGDVLERNAIRYALEHVGITVAEAETVEDGLQQIKEIMPELVILAANLPAIDGLTVRHSLRANPRTTSITMLQLTTSAFDNETDIHCLDADTDTYLTSPLDLRILVSTVRILIRIHRAEQELAQARRAIAEAEQARAHMEEAMSSEASHRTKNNLAIISSILQMQADTLSDQNENATILREAITRIHTFAIVHEQMAQTRAQAIELLDVIRRIAHADSDALAEGEVEVTVEGTPVSYHLKVASTLSILANEFIMNALTYGTSVDGNVIKIRINIGVDNGFFYMSVWNSGNPIPEGFDLVTQSGIGLNLVRDIVVDQFGGVVSLRPEAGGTLAEMKIEDDRLRQFPSTLR